MTDLVGPGGTFPDWCELRRFSVLDIGPGVPVEAAASGPYARILVTSGSCQLRHKSGSQVLREGQFIDLGSGPFSLASAGPAQVIVLEGRWGSELGGCGVFRAHNVDAPADKGDPVSYPKHTNIDAHYHDCDEYWLMLEGRATVVVDGEHLPLRPGDCLLIPMGAIHDMPDAPEPVKAVYFEASLRGAKRIGHLWQHTHGPAVSTRSP